MDRRGGEDGGSVALTNPITSFRHSLVKALVCFIQRCTFIGHMAGRHDIKLNSLWGESSAFSIWPQDRWRESFYGGCGGV